MHRSVEAGRFSAARIAICVALALIFTAAAQAQPPAPINFFPSLAQGNIALHPTLEIECPAQPFLASQYQLARDSGFQVIVYDSGEQENDLCSHVVRNTLSELTTYFWRARVRILSTQWTPYSNPSFFLTMSATNRSVNVFQDGVFSYAATKDSDIRGSFADPNVAIREWNQGAQNVIRAGRRPANSPTDEIYRTLIRFDLSLLSDPTLVRNAYLELTGWEHSDESKDFTDRFAIYELKRSWGEGQGLEGTSPQTAEVSWTFSAFPLTWTSPGAGFASDSSPAADRGATALATHQITNVVGSKVRLSSLAFTDVVKNWIQDPGSNDGIILIADDESIQQTLNIATRENGLVHYRPRLVIESEEAAARPPNQPPVANRDITYIGDGSMVMVDPLANDFDPDNGPVAFQPASLINHGQPGNGTLQVIDGIFHYTPDPGFVGKDTISYMISDGEENAASNMVFFSAPPQFGSISASLGIPDDVIFVNGKVGVGDERRIILGQNDSIEIFIDWPPSRFGFQTNFAMYLWLTDTFAPTRAPLDLGLTSLPTPLNPTLSPQPFRRINNVGFEGILGTEKWPGPPTSAAPTTVLNAPNGLQTTVTFTIQGVMPDSASLQGQAAITNGIIVEIQ